MYNITKATVKEILKGHYTGKIVDIGIYFNEYTKLEQATVIVINNHIVEHYIVDESGFIGFDMMMTTGNSTTIKSGL